MDPRQVPRIIGKLGNARGRDNEARVLAACLLPNRPAWIHGARRATKAEDRDGIDIVVESDVGKLFLQVKSSRRGKQEFEERKRRARVVAITAGPGDAPEKLLRRVVGGLAVVRAEYLAQRGGASEPPEGRTTKRSDEQEVPRPVASDDERGRVA